MAPPPVVHIVDDDGPVRDALGLLLMIEGFQVQAYSSAEDLLEAGPVSGCIVTDVQMPGIGGVGLLEQLNLRRIARPVIMITGRASSTLARRAQALGVVQVVEKPFSADEIVAAVRSAMALADR